MVQTCSRTHIEAPSVPVAFDHVTAQITVGKRRALVRAEIFDGMKLAAGMKEGQLSSVQQLDRRAAPLGHILYAPDRDGLAPSLRLFEITRFRVVRLHHCQA